MELILVRCPITIFLLSCCRFQILQFKMSQEISFKIQSDDSPSIKQVLAYLKGIRSITCNQEKSSPGL